MSKVVEPQTAQAKLDRAERSRLQERGAAIVNASRTAAAAPKPLASLLDFASPKVNKRVARERLKQLRNDLSAVLNLPGAGLATSVNGRAAKRIVAEIAEYRKILDNQGAN